METPITRKMLQDWGGKQTLRDAETLISNGQVLEASYDPPFIKGSLLHNNRSLETSCRILPDRSIESFCPCYTNKERGLICSHVIALGLSILLRQTDPERDKKYREEQRRASRLEEFNDSDYIMRVKTDVPGAIPAKVAVSVDARVFQNNKLGIIPVTCDIELRNKKTPIDEIPTDIPLLFSSKDEALLFVLEDIAQGPGKHKLDIQIADFINIIKLHRGRSIGTSDSGSITVNEAEMSTILRMDLDRENGELILLAHTELPFMKPGEFPLYFVSGREGFVFGAGNIWPLKNILPGPYHSIYSEPVIISRKNILQFLQLEAPKLGQLAAVESDISLDLFTIEPEEPGFKMVVKGSPASLSAVLSAQYKGLEIVAGKPDAKEHFSTPDPDDLMRFTVRNLNAEKTALSTLKNTGFTGECGDDLSSIVGKREVLNFLGSHLPSLRRRGWKIQIEGRVTAFMDSLDFITPVVHVGDCENDSWFDVGFDFEDSKSASISPIDIQNAIRKGESFINYGGNILLFDADAISSMQDVFHDCESGESTTPGHFRLSNIYSSFVKSSLDSLDGIDVEETPAWRTRAEQYNRTVKIEPVSIGNHLDNILRPYQKDGVNWLRFLEKSGFCGLLADEMGLGKTLQTLVWLQLKRLNPDAENKPSIIVCPTSLVENWIEEAARFTPDIKTLNLTGGDRKNRWNEISGTDIAVTSYAILRRDIDQYKELEFSTAVLDEAQHIKNKSTQNALAAKLLKAHNKLVLTGTPIENSVSDLWSIMDFLMPGYLSSHEVFRQNYELPISKCSRPGEIAQKKLRRKLNPFLLRRMKIDVAKDLPDKIQKIASCTLSPDQRVVYNELLKMSQKKISSMVSTHGFNKCRMEILKTLLRLRQICCHLDLIKLPDLKPEQPSAKMELFFELVDEAVDGGHRVLVFSQFVSMLTILRHEMEKRDLAYCYLDGSTKNRQEIVRQFNTERNIPVFLISLKAGGTGLNLTGADMVIHFDPWWNPAVEDQATDRAHRIGQKRTVYSIKMITKDTVEEKVLAMQRQKKAIINATISSDEKMISSMSWEDVRELLEL